MSRRGLGLGLGLLRDGLFTGGGTVCPLWRDATLADIDAPGFWQINFNDPRVWDLVVRGSKGVITAFTDPDTGLTFQSSGESNSGILVNDPEAGNRISLSIKNDGTSNAMNYAATSANIGGVAQGFSAIALRVEDPTSLCSPLVLADLGQGDPTKPRFQLRDEPSDRFQTRAYSTLDGVVDLTAEKNPAGKASPFACGLNWDKNLKENCSGHYMDGQNDTSIASGPYQADMSIIDSHGLEVLRNGGSVGNYHIHSIHGWTRHLTLSEIELWAAINAWESGPQGAAVLDPSNPYKTGRPQYCEATGEFRAKPVAEQTDWRPLLITDILLRGFFGTWLGDPRTEFTFVGDQVDTFSTLDQRGGVMAATAGNRRGLLEIDPKTGLQAIRTVIPGTAGQAVSYSDEFIPVVDVYSQFVCVFAAWRCDDSAGQFNAAQLVDTARDTKIQCRDQTGDKTAMRFEETGSLSTLTGTDQDEPAFTEDLGAMGVRCDRSDKEGNRHYSFQGTLGNNRSGAYLEGGLFLAKYLEVNIQANNGATGHFYHYGMFGWSDDPEPYLDEIFGIQAWIAGKLDRLTPGAPGYPYKDGRPMLNPDTGEIRARNLIPESELAGEFDATYDETFS